MSATIAKIDIKPKYEPGEKLLCFHGPLMYEAKCLDVKVKEDGVMYFVHYQGWNKNWDEWVTDKRMFKYNEEGLKKQKELERQIRSGKVKVLRKSDLKSQSLPPPEVLKDVERTLKPSQIKQEEGSPKAKQSKSNDDADQRPATPIPTEVNKSEDTKPATKPVEESHAVTPNSTAVSSRRRKSRATSGIKSIENDDGILLKPQLVVSIPPSLKAWLVDDWDLITRQARLYELPASQPISNLLSDFLESAEVGIKSEPTSETQSSQSTNPVIRSDLRREFVAGIQHYFNLIIGSHLLYKFERLQYAELLKRHTDKRMSDIYGSIHLLRLFVKLRDMVSCTKVDVNSLPILEALVAEFLQFLKQNESRYFRLEDYTVATAEYQRRAMC
ncbi:hypothetical protein MN116_003964 [Schistosoma mekongi]|uniref:Chromo domain-containing protein n=1 Tax=Schistosoma mekongi TaxID=38744 RepID=A0AAE1ZF71_SCHME|nr:hypothetical protein MN116_003964 [Schistosoma mekongi]